MKGGKTTGRDETASELLIKGWKAPVGWFRRIFDEYMIIAIAPKDCGVGLLYLCIKGKRRRMNGDIMEGFVYERCMRE